jgi:hypothetical protein
MNRIKTSVIALSLLSLTAIANAENTNRYQVMYGPKEISGENITFEKTGKWIKAPAQESAWTNVGQPTGCSAWSPDPSTMALGTNFTQSATNCTQEQTRTVQEREQNDYTLQYRNVGSNKTENQTLTNQTITRQAAGTKIVEECNVPNSVWVGGSSGYRLISITFNGVYLYEGGDYASTEKVVNGYNYKRTGLIGNYGSYQTYNVCRTKI